MRSVKEKMKQIGLRFGKILLFLLLILTLLYGCLLLWLRAMIETGLQEAKAYYTTVSVTITDMEPVENNPLWCVVTLEPSADCDPQMKQEIGTTCATALRRQLQVGSTVTMYCDPEHIDQRVVDFGNTDELLPMGILLIAGSAGGIFLLIFLSVRRRKHRVPAVQVAEGQ